MTLAEFKKKLRNLEPGREIVYHTGELAVARDKNEEINQIASMALAVDDIGAGAVFQRRLTGGRGFEYIVRVFRKLGFRKDENGAFQEVQRVANLNVGRIREGKLFA